MTGYSILTNRKRAIIALVHSIAFLMIAGFGVRSAVHRLGASSSRGPWIMTAVYLLVSLILATLAALSGTKLERLYFLFCTASASFGLMRQIVGDPAMHAAVYIRIAMLLCAVLNCMLIVRAHGARREPEPEMEMEIPMPTEIG